MTIALEPEAASVYCRYLPLQATNQEQSSAISEFKVGSKYMVVDAGGEFEHMFFKRFQLEAVLMVSVSVLVNYVIYKQNSYKNINTVSHILQKNFLNSKSVVCKNYLFA